MIGSRQQKERPCKDRDELEGLLEALDEIPVKRVPEAVYYCQSNFRSELKTEWIFRSESRPKIRSEIPVGFTVRILAGFSGRNDGRATVIGRRPVSNKASYKQTMHKSPVVYKENS